METEPTGHLAENYPPSGSGLGESSEKVHRDKRAFPQECHCDCEGAGEGPQDSSILDGVKGYGASTDRTN